MYWNGISRMRHPSACTRIRISSNTSKSRATSVSPISTSRWYMRNPRGPVACPAIGHHDLGREPEAGDHFFQSREQELQVFTFVPRRDHHSQIGTRGDLADVSGMGHRPGTLLKGGTFADADEGRG